ncbi:hypothetical protein, variant [Verruconis gallopava]|uniref:Glycerophosphocholine acyltransferase 1 n=1 Tax=Verruconis gallopava TaxID=253628 RepID=A0A0D1Y1G7_9PEZI|nr:hypothetical protein, variant [Verruconis gallopava]KIW08916.1 hypothetical protein, variant [Verruconis gallopava]
MAVASQGPPTRSNSRPSLLDKRSTVSISEALEQDSRDMAEQPDMLKREAASQPSVGQDDYLQPTTSNGESTHSSAIEDDHGSGSYAASATTPGTLSRTASFSGDEYDESVPPLDRLTIFDLIENLALPQRLERLQSQISLQTEKVRRQQERIKSSGQNAKNKVVEEWRRRVPTAEEQLEKYKRRMRQSVDRLNSKWNDSRSVTLREKISFIAGVMNVFLSGYIVGGWPHLYPYWYSAQLLYFMPIRFYTYHKKGYHYFLADLCYFVNVLTMLSIWVFPNSKRLFISAFCLAFGNNAIAIAMWRNSLVFHSMDKVVSLFIHIMPCVTLHCIVHLIPPELQAQRYPAIYKILTSDPSSPQHYSLWQMMFWASWPYAVWQLSYHIFISVRRAEKIAAGRPTSFTWLRRSFANTWIGKFVLSLPESMQETAYMLIQYTYALLTMIPCPLWFWYRWASGTFLMVVFTWSVWNGATFYIDVFGMRFAKELEQLKKDVAKWQNTPELMGKTPLISPDQEHVGNPLASPPPENSVSALQKASMGEGSEVSTAEKPDINQIPPLDAAAEAKGTGAETRSDEGGMKERRSG